jgi:hypothetical protein
MLLIIKQAKLQLYGRAETVFDSWKAASATRK